jgi:nucleotide-binding universal stress UspA family protein
MTNADVVFRSPPGAVVVGVDGSVHSTRALGEATELARVENRRLHIVNACDPNQWRTFTEMSQEWSRDIEAAALASAEKVLSDAAAAAGHTLPGELVTTEVVIGDAREVLEAASARASALVVGSRGRGPVRSMMLGSVGVWVSQHAQCPVLVTRAHPDGETPVGIAVGDDGSAASAAALEFAHQQASLRRAPLMVVHCVPDTFQGGYGVVATPEYALDDMKARRRTVAESLAGFAERYPDVPRSVEVIRGRPEELLSRLTPPPVLMVVGSRHRSRLGALFGGSVSRAVVEHARCTVAVVPAGDHPESMQAPRSHAQRRSPERQDH